MSAGWDVYALKTAKRPSALADTDAPECPRCGSEDTRWTRGPFDLACITCKRAWDHNAGR